MRRCRCFIGVESSDLAALIEPGSVLACSEATSSLWRWTPTAPTTLKIWIVLSPRLGPQTDYRLGPGISLAAEPEGGVSSAAYSLVQPTPFVGPLSDVRFTTGLRAFVATRFASLTESGSKTSRLTDSHCKSNLRIAACRMRFQSWKCRSLSGSARRAHQRRRRPK